MRFIKPYAPIVVDLVSFRPNECSYYVFAFHWVLTVRARFVRKKKAQETE